MLRSLRSVRRQVVVRLRQHEAQPVGPSAPPSGEHDPLRVTIPTNELGLPVTPLPPPIASIPVRKIDTALLNRLHELTALNPPEGPEAEQLAHDLGELIGLMDLVEPVTVDDVPGLLSEGMEVVFDADAVARRTPAREEASGRELLRYATRRVGDYYGFHRGAQNSAHVTHASGGRDTIE